MKLFASTLPLITAELDTVKPPLVIVILPVEPIVVVLTIPAACTAPVNVPAPLAEMFTALTLPLCVILAEPTFNVPPTFVLPVELATPATIAVVAIVFKFAAPVLITCVALTLPALTLPAVAVILPVVAVMPVPAVMAVSYTHLTLPTNREV